jgi:ligand-binding sensor domain-containing protein
VKFFKPLVLCPLLFALSACSEESTKTETTAAQAQNPATVVSTESGKDQIPQIIDTFDVGPSVYVRSLAVESAANRLWVGTSLGVLEINLADNNLVNTFTRDHGLANEYVFGIGIDADSYKWFGTNAGGMSRYKDGDWKTYFPMHGLADYWVYSFANDHDGGLWIGTWAGANYFNRHTNEFKTYVKELINEWVYGISVDSKGTVWFGTEGGVSRFDGDTWTSWSHKDGLGGENADALPFSRNTGLGTRSRHDLGMLTGGKPTYNPNYVFSIFADREDSIWAGTWGGGVTRYKNAEWTNLMEKDGLAGNIVYSITQDQDGSYWFGTNKGLSRYDGHSWDNWNIHNGLLGNDVYAIAIAPGGDIWVGTRGGVTRMAIKKS